MKQDQSAGGPQAGSPPEIQTEAYVPTYTIRQPDFTKAILGAIGKYPFNQIQAVMTAVKVPKMDHNQLNQIMNALGSFPYQDIAELMASINSFIVMEEPEDEDDDGGDLSDPVDSGEVLGEDEPQGEPPTSSPGK